MARLGELRCAGLERVDQELPLWALFEASVSSLRMGAAGRVLEEYTSQIHQDCGESEPKPLDDTRALLASDDCSLDLLPPGPLLSSDLFTKG